MDICIYLNDSSMLEVVAFFEAKAAVISYLLNRCHQKVSLLAQHIDAFDFVDGVTDRLNSYGFMQYGTFSKWEVIQYLRKRKTILDSAAWWGLSDEQKSEREFIDLFDQYANKKTMENSFFCLEDLYEIDMHLLDQGKPEYAALFLSQVRPDQKNYKQAIEECIHYFRSVNNVEEATYYAERIGATEFAPSLYCLSRSIDPGNNTSFQVYQESLLRQHSIFSSNEKNGLTPEPAASSGSASDYLTRAKAAGIS